MEALTHPKGVWPPAWAQLELIGAQCAGAGRVWEAPAPPCAQSCWKPLVEGLAGLVRSPGDPGP